MAIGGERRDRSQLWTRFSSFRKSCKLNREGQASYAGVEGYIFGRLKEVQSRSGRAMKCACAAHARDYDEYPIVCSRTPHPDRRQQAASSDRPRRGDSARCGHRTVAATGRSHAGITAANIACGRYDCPTHLTTWSSRHGGMGRPDGMVRGSAHAAVYGDHSPGGQLSEPSPRPGQASCRLAHEHDYHQYPIVLQGRHTPPGRTVDAAGLTAQARSGVVGHRADRMRSMRYAVCLVKSN